mgnify:CR=1 FL=1
MYRKGDKYAARIKVDNKSRHLGSFPTAELLGETYGLDQLDDALAMLQRKDPARDAVRVGLVHH